MATSCQEKRLVEMPWTIELFGLILSGVMLVRAQAGGKDKSGEKEMGRNTEESTTVADVVVWGADDESGLVLVLEGLGAAEEGYSQVKTAHKSKGNK